MIERLMNMKPVIYTIDTVQENFEKMYHRKNISPMHKIRLKSWLHHSESRHRNGNKPFHIDNFARAMGADTYLNYIELDLIDCTDIGGKEAASQIVRDFYQ